MVRAGARSGVGRRASAWELVLGLGLVPVRVPVRGLGLVLGLVPVFGLGFAFAFALCAGAAGCVGDARRGPAEPWWRSAVAGHACNLTAVTNALAGDAARSCTEKLDEVGGRGAVSWAYELPNAQQCVAAANRRGDAFKAIFSGGNLHLGLAARPATEVLMLTEDLVGQDGEMATRASTASGSAPGSKVVVAAAKHTLSITICGRSDFDATRLACARPTETATVCSELVRSSIPR